MKRVSGIVAAGVVLFLAPAIAHAQVRLQQRPLSAQVVNIYFECAGTDQIGEGLCSALKQRISEAPDMRLRDSAHPAGNGLYVQMRSEAMPAYPALGRSQVWIAVQDAYRPIEPGTHHPLIEKRRFVTTREGMNELADAIVSLLRFDKIYAPPSPGFQPLASR